MPFLFWTQLRDRWPECLAAAVIVALTAGVLVAQRSVTAAAEDEVHDLAHTLGRNMLVVPAATDLTDFHALRFGAETLSDDAPARLRASSVAPHLRLVQPRLYGNLTVRGVPLVLVGEEPPPGRARSGFQPPAEGVAVLGATAADRLGVAAGDSLEVNGVPLRVGSVTAAPPDGLDTGVFVRLGTAQQVLGRPGALNALRLGGCWCRVDVATLAADVERTLPGSKAITVKSVLAAQTGAIDTVRRYGGLLFGGAAAVVAALVVLLVGSQVRRRRPEIGLLLAVGARPRTIPLLFVAQAALVGAVGGALGALAAAPLLWLVSGSVLDLPLRPPVTGALPVIGVLVVVGALAAVVPALRAARLDPTTVLREE